jgi:DNA-binding CsgD family transcriptional regulator
VWAALVHVSRGDFARARPYLDEAWGLTAGHAPNERPTDVHTHVPVHMGFAQYHLFTGDHARAIEVGEAGLAIAERTGYLVWAIHRLLPTIIEAALWQRDLPRARRTADRLREVSTRIGHRLGLIWSDAADGLIARLEGDRPRAAALLAGAADELERVPWVLDSARLRRFLARVLIELDDRDGAARELRRGHQVLVRLRAESELEHVREMLRELGARAPARAPSTGAGALTGRELDIARLVVARKSNKGIAEALQISPRTVSTHVSNILAKLSVRSRGELADVMREEPPVRTPR